MKTLQGSARIALALFTIITAGCTTQSWYEGVKLGAENNSRRQPQSEVQGCLDRLNRKFYEEYEKERTGQK